MRVTIQSSPLSQLDSRGITCKEQDPNFTTGTIGPFFENQLDKSEGVSKSGLAKPVTTPLLPLTSPFSGAKFDKRTHCAPTRIFDEKKNASKNN